MQLRADNLLSLSVKKRRHPALTKPPGNFSVEKDAKNVFLEKSHLCFNQELLKHTFFPLTGLDLLWTHAFVSCRTDFP